MTDTIATHEAQKSEQQGASPEYSTGPLRVQTLRGFEYFYIGKKITMPEIKMAFSELMPKLHAALGAERTTIEGVLIARYIWTSVPPEPFTLEVGYAVMPGTQPAGDARIQSVTPFRCASTIYCGDLAHITKGYDALEAAIKQARLQGGMEMRECYYYFEDNSTNVIDLQHGLA